MNTTPTIVTYNERYNCSFIHVLCLVYRNMIFGKKTIVDSEVQILGQAGRCCQGVRDIPQISIIAF
jgi:hypothetical protein